MFAETRVRTITVTKAEAVEVIIRNLHAFADSKCCAGHDYEEAFRYAVRAIEQRDVAALAYAVREDGDAEAQLFPDGVNLDGVTIDDTWVVENLAGFVLNPVGISPSVNDIRRLLHAGGKLPWAHPKVHELTRTIYDVLALCEERLQDFAGDPGIAVDPPQAEFDACLRSVKDVCEQLPDEVDDCMVEALDLLKDAWISMSLAETQGKPPIRVLH